MNMLPEDAIAGDGTIVARKVALGMIAVPPLTAFFTGGPLVSTLLAVATFAGLALATPKLEPRARPMLLALVLIGQCMAFTAAFAGHPWQLDSHMLFFAMLAIVATMSSIPAVLFACGLIAAHHLLLGLVLPAMVYPSAAFSESILRTSFHATIVVLEAAVLVWSMMRTAKANAEVRSGRAKLAETVAEVEEHAKTEAVRERAIAAAETTRREARQAAVAVEEIVAAAKAAATNAAHARTVVAHTKAEAERSSTVMGQTMETMTDIKKSADEIARIVGAIDEIARQTDLLALNAAIEAARAGVHGKGFAVVAGETRKLAQRAADATQQIHRLVTTSALQVNQGTDLVGETDMALARIVTAVSDLNRLMEGIAASTAEQSVGLDQINVAITRIDSIAKDGGETSDPAASGVTPLHARPAVRRDRKHRMAG